MPAFDHSIKAIAHLAGSDLARLAGLNVQDWEAVESTLQTTELLADRVFRAKLGGKPFVVYMEFYTQWDADAPWDLLAKAGLLSKREQLPTLPLIFILTRRGYRSQRGTFQLQIPAGPTQQLWFREIPLWQHRPPSWLKETPAWMPLYPLFQHEKRPRQAIEYAADVIKAAPRI